MRNQKIKTGFFFVVGFFAVFFFFGGGSVMKPQVAHAWDLNDPNNYIIPNSIYLDHTGDLNFDWARGIANHLQGAPGGYLSLSLNGTSTDGTALIALSSGQPGYCRGTPDNFGADSQDTYGNHNVFTQIYDAQAGQVVSTQGITTLTPIYINMYGDIPAFNWGTQYCYGVGTQYYGSAGPFYINFSAEQLMPLFLQPFNGETMSDFPSWIIDLSVNRPPATGTLEIHYGDINASTFPSSDTIPYDIECDSACDTSISVPKSGILGYPQQQGSIEWWVYAEVVNTSTSVDISGQVETFYINPNAPQYSSAPSSTFIGPTLGEASTTAVCQFTTQSFLDDPSGNIEQSVCNVFSYLFLPSNDQQADLYQRFNSQWTQVSTRVPFGYVGIIQTAFSNFQEGTNTSTLITTTTYAALSLVLDPLKTGIAFMLILMLGFYLFYFARNITL